MFGRRLGTGFATAGEAKAAAEAEAAAVLREGLAALGMTGDG